MPVLEQSDVQGWDRPRVEREMRERLAAVGAIREGNGGTLEGVQGADAELVREHNASLNVLGEALDGLNEQRSADERHTRLSAYLDEPDPETQLPRAGNGGRPPRQETRDVGSIVLESDAWRAFREEGRKDVAVEVPVSAVFPSLRGIGEIGQMNRQATLFQSSAFPIQADFREAPIDVLTTPNNIAPLMPQGTTSANTVRIVREVVTASGAAAVAEGATKPEANISFTPADEPVRKIAVLLPITDESLDDVPFLRSYLNSRLSLFVQNEENRELLIGTGTPPEIQGILNRSGIDTSTSYSIGGANADQALIDGVFKASMRVRDSFLEPDAVVMKPATWEIARLAKDAQRNYLLGPPGVDAPQRLWGLAVVLNANMPAQAATNKPVLVGAFGSAAMVVRRGPLTVSVSDSHSTFFAENKLMLRVEERLGLLVFRPGGFATVTSAV